MPVYKVSDPSTGRSVSLTGDSPPTEQELNNIFAKIGGGNRLAEMPAETPQEMRVRTGTQGGIVGFGQRAEKDVRNLGQGIADLAKGAVSYIPKLGYDIGRDIAKTYEENRTITDKLGGVKAVAKRVFIEPPAELAKHPIKNINEQILQPAGDVSRGIIKQYADIATHPIREFSERPVQTLLAVAPVAKWTESKLGLTPKTRPVKIDAKATALEKKATDTYRDMLRPTQGEIKNIEIRQGKNIDDYYRLAAKEKLPIEQTVQKGLDTKKAVAMLEGKLDDIHTQLNTKLADSTKTFNLKDIANKAKGEIDRVVKNASEAKSMKAEIDDFIVDEVARNKGRNVVTTAQLNDIKQGMWKVGYNAMKPTAKATARKIGFIAKEALEKSFIDPTLKMLNQQSGQYQTLINLLENAQNRVVKGGRLGGYAARGLGAIAGHSTGLPVVGPVLGAWAGDAAANAIYAPERMSRLGSNAMTKANKLRLGNSAIDKMVTGIDRIPNRLPPSLPLKKALGNQTGGIGKGEKLVTVYHRTNTPIEQIKKEGFKSLENTGDIFVSNKKIGQAEGYGKNIVELKINPKYLILDDEFPNGEKHFAINKNIASKYFQATGNIPKRLGK